MAHSTKRYPFRIIMSMPIYKRPISSIVFTVVHHRFFHLLPSNQFLIHHVATRPPTPRSLRHSVNNHGALSTLYSRVPSNSYSYSHFHPDSPVPSSTSPSILLARRVRPRVLRFSPFRTPSHSPAMRMFVSTERLSSAWRHTPMKWNPLPWFVGALLLVLIQYRRHRSEKEVHVDEDGHEVIKLKGPWQVSPSFSSLHCSRVIPPFPSCHVFFFTAVLRARAVSELLCCHTACSTILIIPQAAASRVDLLE